MDHKNRVNTKEQITEASFAPSVWLKKWACILVRGPGAEKLLQGQFSCDVTALEPLKPQLGAYCTLQGKVLVSFYLIKIEEQDNKSEYWLVLPQDCQTIMLSTLQKYAVFFDVHMQAMDAPVIGVWRSSNPTAEMEGIKEGLLTLPFDQQRQFILNGVPKNKNLSEDNRAWRYADWQQGIVHVDTALSELYLPNVLNYPKYGAVDFHKGCYRGQEIVARVHYRGQLKHRLAQLSLRQISLEEGFLLQQASVFYRDQSSKILFSLVFNSSFYALALLPADFSDAVAVMTDAKTQQNLDWNFVP